MLIKRILMAAAAAFSLSLLADAAMAAPVSAAKSSGSPADQQAPVASHSPLMLVKGGGHGGGGHSGGHSSFSSGSRSFSSGSRVVGHGATFSRHGRFRDRDRDGRRPLSDGGGRESLSIAVAVV